MKQFFLALTILSATASLCHAEKLVWKIEKELGEAKQLPSCSPEKDKNCPDQVASVSQSKFGAKVYKTYHEAVRIVFSFSNDEKDGFTVAADQVHPGSYDWGGVMRKGKFKPLYMIKRFYTYDAAGTVKKANTELTVLRLLPGGKSCGIYTGGKTLTDNSLAHRYAEKDYARPTCTQ
jgi:hypothetical protein